MVQATSGAFPERREKSLLNYSRNQLELRQHSKHPCNEIFIRFTGSSLPPILPYGFKVTEADLQHGKTRVLDRLDGRVFAERLPSVGKQVSDMQIWRTM
jgi:hypothetical protein